MLIPAYLIDFIKHMCYIYKSFLWNPPEKVVPVWKAIQMMDLAMVITTAAIMYITAWSLHHDKMSGIMPSIMAVIAATVIVFDLAAYMVVLLLILPWSISAAVFTATATLFVTCSLARINARSSKLKRDNKSR